MSLQSSARLKFALLHLVFALVSVQTFAPTKDERKRAKKKFHGGDISPQSFYLHADRLCFCL